MNTQKIKIGIGLGDVQFGCTREELIKNLGDPTETDQYKTSEDEDYLTEAWHYDEQEFSASFDEEDNWRLTTFSVSSPDTSFNNHQLIGKGIEEVSEILKSLNLGEMETEDLSSDGINFIMVSFIESSINFWFDDNILSEIQWGVLWEDEDNPIWPK
jgi:hypothetical protein